VCSVYKRNNPFFFLLTNDDEAVCDTQLHRFCPRADTDRPRAFTCVSGEVELALVRDICFPLKIVREKLMRCIDTYARPLEGISVGNLRRDHN
jgi:hypothetical protein